MEWSRLYFLCGFTFNPIGLSLTATPFSLQAVSFLGIFGLSFWVILTNLAVWKKRWKAAAILAVSPYALGGMVWGIHQAGIKESPIMNIALVQTALLPSQKLYFPERAADFIPPHEQWNRITTLLAQVKEPVDLVVLPESAVSYSDHYPLYSSDVIAKILQNSFHHPFFAAQSPVTNRTWTKAIGEILDADVIIGLDGQEEGQHYSSAFFTSKETIQRYDKQILLPLAEYLPFTSLIALTKSYGISKFFTHGKESTLFHSKVPLSTSICYEETFGHILREGRKNGAALFVNVTNDNWYPSTKLPKQHFDLAKAQAVANGAPLVRACNAGVTSAVDCLGHVVAQLDDWNSPAVLVAKVPLYQIKTLYTFLGDAGIVLVSIILLTLSVVINRSVLGVKL
jgi:apolipoprotein N-acyltransferase